MVRHGAVQQEQDQEATEADYSGRRPTIHRVTFHVETQHDVPTERHARDA